METVQARKTVKYPVYRGRPEHDAQSVFLHYVVGRGCLTGLDDRTRPLGFCRMLHQSRSLSLYCIVMGSRSDGDRHANSPRCCKRCRSVRAGTGWSVKMSVN
ncbi:hypothetical protein TNCV_1584721 [Trichonephila clavipes]|nr:hypothetical protein TNCV_1584721 [Trichonephila clavipes]